VPSHLLASLVDGVLREVKRRTKELRISNRILTFLTKFFKTTSTSRRLGTSSSLLYARLYVFCCTISVTAGKNIPKTKKNIGVVGKGLLLEMSKKIERMI
jgi:hypothetical protein